MARIAVDMDEVIADALGEHLSRYNEKFGAELAKSDLLGLHIFDLIPDEHVGAAIDIVHTEDFFADLPVMPNAREVLEELSKSHEIFIATAAMEVPRSFRAKYEWLLRHFPFISPMNFVFCGDKSIVDADYLIDDNARHFLRFKGKGLLFDAPHNRNVQGYTRVNDWLAVKEFFAHHVLPV